jgi:hypothetical protein
LESLIFIRGAIYLNERFLGYWTWWIINKFYYWIRSIVVQLGGWGYGWGINNQLGRAGYIKLTINYFYKR